MLKFPIATNFCHHCLQELSGSHLPVKELGFDTPEDLFISLADSVLQLVFRSSSKLYAIDNLSLVVRKPVFGRFRPGPTQT